MSCGYKKPGCIRVHACIAHACRLAKTSTNGRRLDDKTRIFPLFLRVSHCFSQNSSLFILFLHLFCSILIHLPVATNPPIDHLPATVFRLHSVLFRPTVHTTSNSPITPLNWWTFTRPLYVSYYNTKALALSTSMGQASSTPEPPPAPVRKESNFVSFFRLLGCCRIVCPGSRHRRIAIDLLF